MTYLCLSFTFQMCCTLVGDDQVCVSAWTIQIRAWCHALRKTNAFSCSNTLLPHPSAAPESPLLFNHRAAARNHSFWELLRSCLPSRSPAISLVYSGLPRGRIWAQRRRKPSPCMLPSSTAQAGSGAHCQNTGWLLLSEICIRFVSLVKLISLITFIFFLFLFF